MSDKITVTMYHKEATESIEVMPAQVKNSEVNGWTTENPIKPILKADDIPIKDDSPPKEGKKRKLTLNKTKTD